RAIVRGDRPATTNLLGRAYALLPAGDPRLPNLLVERAAAVEEQGEFDEAERLFADAAGAARVLGNRALELRAELELAHLRILVDPEAAIAPFRELTETAIP